MSREHIGADNAALLLIDHQVGTMNWVRSIALEDMKRNVLMLAKTAQIVKLPVVLSGSMEDDAPGPLLSELSSLLPEAFAARVKRAGITKTFDAMDDLAFAAAVQATGRQNIVIAGAALDISIEFTAQSLMQLGYHVHVIVDAGGWRNQTDSFASLNHMAQSGITASSTRSAITQLIGNWRMPQGSQVLDVMEEIF